MSDTVYANLGIAFHKQYTTPRSGEYAHKGFENIFFLLNFFNSKHVEVPYTEVLAYILFLYKVTKLCIKIWRTEQPIVALYMVENFSLREISSWRGNKWIHLHLKQLYIEETRGGGGDMGNGAVETRGTWEMVL